MERGEPSLVPEWLRNTGGGAVAGTSSHHFAASQADAPVLALPKRNRSSKSMGNPDALHSSLLDRSSSSNSRRTSSSNGSTKHDKNSYSRSYISFNRSHRDRDRERLTITDNWDLEYSDPLRSMITGRTEGSLRRSQSMISRRQGEVQQRRVSTDNGNGTHTVGSSVAGIQKVSFERDFPQLGSDDRPKTPDIVRVASPGLSRSMQMLSIGNSSLIGSEGWTSALAEVPTGAGSNGIGSSSSPQPSPTAAASRSNSTSGAGNTLNGLNMAEALVQAPARSHNVPQSSAQLQRDELAIAQSKKLIPMTPSLPKTLVNQSDKLKPKTPGRSGEVMVVPKNGVQQLSPLQLGGQSVRGTSARVEGPKSPSGKLLLLKPGRENGGSTVMKDVQVQTTTSGNKVANNQSAAVPSVASVSVKSPSNPRFSSGERKAPGFGSNLGQVAEKRNFQSRSDFFNLMRKKSMNSTSVSTDSGTDANSNMEDESDKEQKELSSAQITPVENGNKVKCNGEACTAAETCSESEDDNAAIYPNEEEKAFLRSLGWEENAEDDEALTEEEINAFYQEVWRLRATSKLCRDRWPKILSHFELGAACSGAASTEPSASASQT